MDLFRTAVTITTDASGDATDYIAPVSGSGRVLAIIYTKDDYDAGVDFTITTETLGLNVWTDTNVNASETVHPSILMTDGDGSATSPEARRAVPFVNERIKIVVGSGGNAKSGTFTLISD